MTKLSCLDVFGKSDALCFHLVDICQYFREFVKLRSERLVPRKKKSSVSYL